MGNLQAMEMAHLAPNPDIGLEWHLRSNHYPPVHIAFVPVAKQAIEAAVEANLTEEWELLDEVVTMPNGLEKSLGEIVEGLHLWAFIDARIEVLTEGDEE